MRLIVDGCYPARLLSHKQRGPSQRAVFGLAVTLALAAGHDRRRFSRGDSMGWRAPPVASRITPSCQGLWPCHTLQSDGAQSHGFHHAVGIVALRQTDMPRERLHHGHD